MTSNANTNSSKADSVSIEDTATVSTEGEGTRGMEVDRVVLLTKRKSERATCELCSQVGAFVCRACKVTYYCSIEHFSIDRQYHVTTCARLKEIRTSVEFSPLVQTRARLARHKEQLCELLFADTWAAAQDALKLGNYDHAITCGCNSLRMAYQLKFGGVEKISLMMIIAEAYLSKGKAKVADGFLARALSIEVSDEQITPTVKAAIRHVEGLLALCRANYEEAIRCFANEAYEWTEDYGPEHIRTSVGYCYLGHVFYKTGRYPTSSSFYRQTVSIWIDFLEPIFVKVTDEDQVPVVVGVKPEEKPQIASGDQLDGWTTLMRCYNEQLSTYETTATIHVTHLDLAHTCYALCLHLFLWDKIADSEIRGAECQMRLSKAHAESHPLRTKVANVRKYCRRRSYQSDKVSGIRTSATDSAADPAEAKAPTECSEPAGSVNKSSPQSPEPGSKATESDDEELKLCEAPIPLNVLQLSLSVGFLDETSPYSSFRSITKTEEDPHEVEENQDLKR